MTTHPIVAEFRSRATELRDQATELTRSADEVTTRMAEPAALLERMAADEAELMRRLDALRREMLAARKEYDALAVDRQHHADHAAEKQRAADYIEQTTVPDLVALLAATPPAEALASVALQGAVVPAPVPDPLEPLPLGADTVRDSRAEVAALTGGHPIVAPEQDARALAEALESGNPLRTLGSGDARPDARPDDTGPRHAVPRPPRRGVTAPLKALTGLGRGETPQNGDDQ